MMLNSMKAQRGATLMFSLIFMLSMVAAIGMATDTGHWLVNKTRLQNALDATALSAAIALNADPNKSTANAEVAGKATFAKFIAGSGNHELSGLTGNDLAFQFSSTLNPWNAGSAPPYFVRVSTNALSIAPILIQVLPAFANPINIAAVSTAGAVGQNCNLVPFVMCAKMSPSLDTNCNDDTIIMTIDAEGHTSAALGQDGVNDCYGYNIGQQINLYQACNGNNTGSCPPNSLETGNFNLLNIGGAGASVISNALQGTQNICSGLGNNLDTQPGYAWGPVSDGINTRFYSDTNTTIYPQPNAYSQYASSGTGNGKRNMAVPFADCNGLQTGNSIIPLVGVACDFLVQPSPAGGSNKVVYAEFTGKSCQQSGAFDPNNGVLNGPYRVVLFKSSGSNDS